MYEKEQRIPSVKKYVVLEYNDMMWLHAFVPQYTAAFPRLLSSWFAVCKVSLRARLTYIESSSNLEFGRLSTDQGMHRINEQQQIGS